LRPFRLDDAAAVAQACTDPSVPRFTMMADDLSENDARRWIASGLEWWTRGRMQLVTHLENVASQRVAERCGFRREGILRAWQPVKATQPDVIMWSRLATDAP
jgi:RimJ/RimL family protein N-acetyltransferase